MQILIVDDNLVALDLLEHTLRRSGYEVIATDNGRDALNILCQGSCQLVVADWEMPEMSGIELCRSIRSSGFMNYIYVILLTSRREASDSIEGMTAGADDMMLKPFQPSELTLRVRAGASHVQTDPGTVSKTQGGGLRVGIQWRYRQGHGPFRSNSTGSLIH